MPAKIGRPRKFSRADIEDMRILARRQSAEQVARIYNTSSSTVLKAIRGQLAAIEDGVARPDTWAVVECGPGQAVTVRADGFRDVSAARMARNGMAAREGADLLLMTTTAAAKRLKGE